MPTQSGDVLNGTDIYRELPPPLRWRHVVECFWEQKVVTARVQRVIPDGFADLLVDNDGCLTTVGMHDQVDLPVLLPGTHIHGVRLRPEVVGRAFRTPAWEIANASVRLDDVLGNERARQFADRSHRVEWLDSLLPSQRTAAAVELLAHRPVGEVANQLGISTRHLRRIMLDEVGLGPGRYQRVARFRRFVGALDRRESTASAAALAGYADQPHATRETRRLAGITPRELVSERHT